MTISKTRFLNYSRCPRYVALEGVKKDALDGDLSYDMYKKEEYQSEISELYQAMVDVDEDGNVVDKTEVVNRQLEAMLSYYKRVEFEAGRIVSLMFGGKTIYAQETHDQVKYEFCLNGIRYLCYVDVYNESEKCINIVEVKATTSKKYTDLAGGYRKGKKYSIFRKKNNIYQLKGEIEGYPLENEMPLESYERERQKLFDRYRVGEYVHDLAVQRFFIESMYKLRHQEDKLPKFHYYLAVLNQNYVFDGTYKDNEPVYHEHHGEELITLFQLDQVTLEYLPLIEKENESILKAIHDMDTKPCPLGISCGYKAQNCCKYFQSVCGKCIPLKNSSLCYVNNPFGFVTDDNKRLKGLELINAGYLHLLDIPERWITKKNHVIQRECVLNHSQFVHKEKIRKALACLEYPIYHLDFETFPCPLPRFKGEWPYIQSPFEFSLHIESSPGVCDPYKDNVVFLAQTTGDEREELIKELLKYIDPDKGTLFAQNVAFEKGRIKELAMIFPKYKESLMKIYNRGFDLLWLLNNNKELYERLGFKGEDLETFNFYDENLSGSFSIKKTLPVFSELSYKDLVVKNGTDAIVEYANYEKMCKEVLKEKQDALRVYCAQDTWAMVEILNALRKIVNEA